MTQLWFPVAPGFGDLPTEPDPTINDAFVPADSIDTPAGFDPDNPGDIFEQLPIGGEPVFQSVLTPTALIPATFEILKYGARIRVAALVEKLEYSLDAGTYEIQLPIMVWALAPTIMRLESGSLSIAGTDLGTVRNYVLNADAGVLAAQGNDAIFLRNYIFSVGSFGLLTSGSETPLLYSRNPLPAEGTSLAIAYPPITWFKGATLPAESLALTTTYPPASFPRNYRLTVTGTTLTATLEAEAEFKVGDYFSRWGTQTYGYEQLIFPESWAE